jgi:hypothetical protein
VPSRQEKPVLIEHGKVFCNVRIKQNRVAAIGIIPLENVSTNKPFL